MLKRDLSRAYRQLRIDPMNYDKLGFKWRNLVYFDISFPFGIRSAAQACQCTTDGLRYMAEKRNIPMINYVDDIAAVASSRMEAIHMGSNIDSIIVESGLCIAQQKSVDATQRMTFLGIVFDSNKMTMEVTSERLEAIQEELKLWSNKRRASKKDIQSLAGKLQFIAKCCPYGRCFMARILAALKGLKRQSHRIYLNEALRKDIRWWQLMLPHFNSVSIIKTLQWSSPDAVIASDACLKGGGGTFRNRFFRCEFPEHVVSNTGGISQREALTVVMAVKLWGHLLVGQKFTINCDNSATVSIINSGRAADVFLQDCAREIIFLACKYQFEVRAEHIAGVDNRLPDLLSRACLDSKHMDIFWCESGTIDWVEDIVRDDMWEFSCPW